MPIYYALVARRKVVLCDHADVTGNFESVSQSILEQLTSSDTQISYQSGRYLFHVVVDGGLTFLCVTEAVFDRAVAFAFLRELQSELVAARLGQRAEIAGPYGLRKEFEATLKRLLQEFSSSDHLERLQSNVKEVQGIMTANIEKVVNRGDALEDLSERSDILMNSSSKFRVNAARLRRTIWWKSCKLWTVVVLIVLLILAIVAALIALRATGKLK